MKLEKRRKKVPGRRPNTGRTINMDQDWNGRVEALDHDQAIDISWVHSEGDGSDRTGSMFSRKCTVEEDERTHSWKEPSL